MREARLSPNFTPALHHPAFKATPEVQRHAFLEVKATVSGLGGSPLLGENPAGKEG